MDARRVTYSHLLLESVPSSHRSGLTGSLRRAASIVAINVIVFGVLAEATALLAHFAKTGHLFYVDRPCIRSGWRSVVRAAHRGRPQSVLRAQPPIGHTRSTSRPNFESRARRPSSRHEQLRIRLAVQLSDRQRQQRVHHRDLRRLGQRVVLPGRRRASARRSAAARVLQGTHARPALHGARRLQAAATGAHPRLLPVDRPAVRSRHQHRRPQRSRAVVDQQPAEVSTSRCRAHRI